MIHLETELDLGLDKSDFDYSTKSKQGMFTCFNSFNMHANQLFSIHDKSTRVKSTISYAHLSLRLYKLLIGAVKNREDKDYIPCTSVYEFMAVPPVIIKPRENFYKHDFITGPVLSSDSLQKKLCT